MKEGDSILGAELTESVAVRPLESGFYVTFIIPINLEEFIIVITYLKDAKCNY